MDKINSYRKIRVCLCLRKLFDHTHSMISLTTPSNQHSLALQKLRTIIQKGNCQDQDFNVLVLASDVPNAFCMTED